MRVPSRYSHEITNIFSFPNSLAMFVPVLLAACWYYPSTLVCLLLDLYTTHCTVHTAKCKVHTALRDAWCQNSKFCNKGRHSMNWRDRRESVNNAKSASSYFFWLQYFVCKHFHICFGEAVPCWLQRLVLFQIIPVLTLLPFFRFVLLWHKVFGTFSN